MANQQLDYSLLLVEVEEAAAMIVVLPGLVQLVVTAVVQLFATGQPAEVTLLELTAVVAQTGLAVDRELRELLVILPALEQLN